MSSSSSSSSLNPSAASHSPTPSFFANIEKHFHKKHSQQDGDFQVLYIPSTEYLEDYGVRPRHDLQELSAESLLDSKFIKSRITAGREYTTLTCSYIEEGIQLLLVRDNWIPGQMKQRPRMPRKQEESHLRDFLIQLFAGTENSNVPGKFQNVLYCVLVFEKEFLQQCNAGTNGMRYLHDGIERESVIQRLMNTRVLHISVHSEDEKYPAIHHTRVASRKDIQSYSQLKQYLSSITNPVESSSKENPEPFPYDIFCKLKQDSSVKITNKSHAHWKQALKNPFISLTLKISDEESDYRITSKYMTFKSKGHELTEIDLSGIGLTDDIICDEANFDWAKEAPNMKKLILSGNKLRRVPSFIFHCENLEDVNLSGNEINDVTLEGLSKETRKEKRIILDLSKNKFKRLRFHSDHPWLSSVKELDLRENPDLFEYPNDLVLWLLEENGTLRADLVGDRKEAHVRELNYSPPVHCYMCTGMHNLHVSEVRTIDIPPTKKDERNAWFEYCSGEDPCGSDTCKLRISSFICKKCWKRPSEGDKVKKFCWKCMDFVNSTGQHACPQMIEKSHPPVSQSSIVNIDTLPSTKPPQQPSHHHLMTPQEPVTQPPLYHHHQPMYSSPPPSVSDTHSTYSSDYLHPSSSIPSTPAPSTSTDFSSMDNGDSGIEDSKFKCDLCDVVCTSQETLDHHLQGKKHQHKLELKKNDTYCRLCGVTATNVHGYNMHIKGAKHSRKYKILRYCIKFSDGKFGLLRQKTTSDGKTYFVYEDPDAKVSYRLDEVSQHEGSVQLGTFHSVPLRGQTRYTLYKEKHGKILGLPEV